MSNTKMMTRRDTQRTKVRIANWISMRNVANEIATNRCALGLPDITLSDIIRQNPDVDETLWDFQTEEINNRTYYRDTKSNNIYTAGGYYFMNGYDLFSDEEDESVDDKKKLLREDLKKQLTALEADVVGEMKDTRPCLASEDEEEELTPYEHNGVTYYRDCIDDLYTENGDYWGHIKPSAVVSEEEEIRKEISHLGFKVGDRFWIPNKYFKGDHGIGCTIRFIGTTEYDRLTVGVELDESFYPIEVKEKQYLRSLSRRVAHPPIFKAEENRGFFMNPYRVYECMRRSSHYYSKIHTPYTTDDEAVLREIMFGPEIQHLSPKTLVEHYKNMGGKRIERFSQDTMWICYINATRMWSIHKKKNTPMNFQTR